MQQSKWSTFEPIPARVVPQPWEDLASLISRVAVDMGYRNPAWILRPEEILYTVQPYRLCVLRDEADYQFFEQLFCLDEETLYQGTLHRFASRLQAPKFAQSSTTGLIQRPLLTRYVFQSFFHPYSATKICPRCLAEGPTYGHLSWNVLPVVACLQHKIFLLDRCPVCLRSIPLLRLSLTHCPYCQKCDYRDAPVVTLPEESHFLRGQAYLLKCLGLESTSHEDEAAGGGSMPLFNLFPWQYFQLFDAFRHVLQPLIPDAPFLLVASELHAQLHKRQRPRSAFSPLEWSVFIATFHELFDSWPDAFYTFLDAFPRARRQRARKRDQERQTGVQRDYGIFYERWLFKRLADPAFSFLNEAFEDYLKRRYTGGEVTRRLLPFKESKEEQWQERPYLTKAQAKAMLRIGEDTLQSLLKQGMLSVLRKPQGGTKNRTVFMVDRAGVEALQREWSTLIPLDQVAESVLGVTKGVVLSLEQPGILTPRRGPHQDGYKIRLYSETATAQFKETLQAHAVRVARQPTNTLGLAKIANHTGVPLVEILKEVLDNRLHLYEVNGTQPLFHRLVLPCVEMSDLLQRYKRQQYCERGLLTIGEAANHLGVGEKVLRGWVQCGLLESEKLVIGGKQPPLLFRRETIEAFPTTYAYLNEVADQLKVVPDTVRKYVRKGRLHPIAGRMAGGGGNHLIFRRDEVDVFMASRELKGNGAVH